MRPAFLSLLLLLPALLHAGAEVTRVADDSCLHQCEAVRSSCAAAGEAGALCEDRFRPCVERCDPQRLDRDSTLALYPPQGRTVSGPRHLLPVADQLALCAQECGLSSSACQTAGNSNRGHGTAVMGGKNLQPACLLAQQGCEQRCQVALKAAR